MQLFNHRHVQLLLCDQYLDIASPPRCRHPHIKKWLGETAITKPKHLDSFLAGPMTALDSADHPHTRIGKGDGTKNETTAASSLQIGFCFLNLGIVFQGPLQRCLQREGVARTSKLSHQHTEKSAARTLHFSSNLCGGCVNSTIAASSRFGAFPLAG